MTSPGGECGLLAGPAAASAQLLLAVAAVGALVYKRHKERPQRSLQVWGMDVSKQVISAGAAHMCGIFIAILASESGKEKVSQCAWYFVAYAFDTTLGVALAIAIHKGFLRICTALAAAAPHNPTKLWQLIVDCGNYGTPPRWKPFLLQLAEWTLAVILSRFTCGSVVLGCKPILMPAAHVLDVLFSGHPVLLLFFVMIMCPLAMNILQALVQDAVLRWKTGAEGHAPKPEAKEDVEVPLRSENSEGVHLMASHQHSTA